MNRPVSLALAATLLTLTALPLAAQAPAPPLKTTELGRGPTIVLVPGLGGARMEWMPTARKLLAGYRVVMVDLPGHGDSPLPNPFTLDAATAALDQVLAKQKAESTIVVGRGTGGTLAILATRAHPERVRGVVAIDVSLKSPFQDMGDQQRKFIAEYLESASGEQYADLIRRMFGQSGRDSAQSVEIISRVSMVPPASIKSFMREQIYFDPSSQLKGYNVPVQYLGSSKSWADTVTWAAFAKQRGFDAIPGIASRRIANSGSMIASDQPDSLAAAIDAFAKRVFAAKK